MSSYPTGRILSRDGFVCAYCGGYASEVDHIVPIEHGGSHNETNVVSTCPRCNDIASGKLFGSFDDKRAYVLSIRRTEKEKSPSPYDVQYGRFTYRVSKKTHTRLKAIALENAVGLNELVRYLFQDFIVHYDSGAAHLPTTKKEIAVITLVHASEDTH